MKKYLFGALALPLLFACSSDDLLEEKVIGNDQFAGIEKVDATFSMDEGVKTRFDNGVWTPEEGDLWGFAWMGDGTNVAIDGKAYQNHNLIQTNGRFEPQTSIYVGSYYIYRPYDKTTVSPQAINFKSLEEQTITEGFASSTQAWKDLAKTAINIGTKWTVVSPAGWQDAADKTWDKAGIKQNYKLYAAMFSNQTGLDLTYTQNDPAFGADTKITGATDIDLTLKKGDKVGAAVIYGGSVDLQKAGVSVAAKSFTYAPTASLEDVDPAVAHKGDYWADKKDLGAAEGFDFATGTGAITLNAPDENGLSTEGKTTGWFWFNSLPVVAGDGDEDTEVIPVFETSYGQVTVKKDYEGTGTNYTVKDCAKALNIESGKAVWHPLADAADLTKTPTVWAIGSNNTFINQYGNHKGKYSVNVDFSKGVMNGMHIKSDEHLQTALKYYIASGKTESPVVLNLDKEADGNFSISKISIALLQTINKTTTKVTVKACATVGHEPAKIVITQMGQTGELAKATEVPALNKVFDSGTPANVYLSKDYTWTWSDKIKTGDIAGNLTVDAGVASITNEGTLTVNATNVQLSTAAPLANAKGATMNITKVTTVKNALTNLGTINVGAADNKTAELRAYGVEIKNDATGLNEGDYGVINNYGVVGVTEGTTPAGTFNNYGLIDMKNGDAITLLSANELVSDFDNAFNASTNKMGTVKLPENNPTAIVSVNNAAANGFIKYTWPATETTYVTPEGNVKYNTIEVSGNIEFTEAETEIQYIEFNGVRTQVVNPGGFLTSLKGVIVNAGKSIIIEKGNKLQPSQGTFLGEGATVYNGGTFKHNAKTVSGTEVSNYFGNWFTDQIVKY